MKRTEACEVAQRKANELNKTHYAVSYDKGNTWQIETFPPSMFFAYSITFNPVDVIENSNRQGNVKWKRIHKN